VLQASWLKLIGVVDVDVWSFEFYSGNIVSVFILYSLQTEKIMPLRDGLLNFYRRYSLVWGENGPCSHFGVAVLRVFKSRKSVRYSIEYT
jgi:hypothetical protein